MTVIYFIIALGVLILVHELGHFILARLSGIRIEKFSIGFGPKLLGFKRGETEYKIAPIPLGGYVKMTGEDPEEPARDDPRSFASKSVWTKMRVVVAGPLMNLALAVILMPVVFMVGRAEPAFWGEAPVVIGVKRESPAEAVGLKKGDLIIEVDGKKTGSWRDVIHKTSISSDTALKIKYGRDGAIKEGVINVASIPELRGGYAGVEPFLFLGDEARIDRVAPNGPADEAGIKPGDIVTAVNGIPVDGWTEMAKIVNESGGSPIEVVIKREGAAKRLTVSPSYSKEYDKWVIGVQKSMKPTDVPMVKKRYGFVDSIKKGLEEFATLFGLTMAVLKKLFTLQLSYKALGGPIQIAHASVVAARYGLGEFISFMAFLSMQLGILNLLPIPVLDGGHLLFCGVEAVIRRPLSIRVRAVAQYIGLVLILSLLLLVTINDIESVWGIKSLIGKLLK